MKQTISHCLEASYIASVSLPTTDQLSQRNIGGNHYNISLRSNTFYGGCIGGEPALWSKCTMLDADCLDCFARNPRYLQAKVPISPNHTTIDAETISFRSHVFKAHAIQCQQLDLFILFSIWPHARGGCFVVEGHNIR